MFQSQEQDVSMVSTSASKNRTNHEHGRVFTKASFQRSSHEHLTQNTILLDDQDRTSLSNVRSQKKSSQHHSFYPCFLCPQGYEFPSEFIVLSNHLHRSAITGHPNTKLLKKHPFCHLIVQRCQVLVNKRDNLFIEKQTLVGTSYKCTCSSGNVCSRETGDGSFSGWVCVYAATNPPAQHNFPSGSIGDGPLSERRLHNTLRSSGKLSSKPNSFGAPSNVCLSKTNTATLTQRSANTAAGCAPGGTAKATVTKRSRKKPKLPATLAASLTAPPLARSR